jgi:hypothetical protein
MTVGDFLLRRLQEAGVGHMFGVPGDFNLELLQQMEDGGYLKWVGTCNEMNASYAADGYARLNGMGAVGVTNAVGALDLPHQFRTHLRVAHGLRGASRIGSRANLALVQPRRLASVPRPERMLVTRDCRRSQRRAFAPTHAPRVVEIDPAIWLLRHAGLSARSDDGAGPLIGWDGGPGVSGWHCHWC